MSAQESLETEHGPRPGTTLEPGAGAGAGAGEIDVNAPGVTRFDLVREGARRDGIEIVVYEPRVEPGSRLEKRMERTVALLFALAGLAGAAFIAAYVWWPWEYSGTELNAFHLQRFYTPVLGVTLGLALFFFGAAIITWVKKLMPHEVAIEQRHDGPSAEEDQRITAATLANVADESGIMRRPLLKGAIALGALPLAVIAAAPIVGGLIRDPHRPLPEMEAAGLDISPQDHTGWHPALNDGNPVRMVYENGTPVRPADVAVAGQITVFPGIPRGTTNYYADSPALLIHLRQEHADQLRGQLYELNEGSMYGNFVAYSKICTHAGCPPSLYEQQTNMLLCPCHQSQFEILNNARPVFGPATRSLAMLPLALDDEGYFVAASDFKVPVGPSYWER
jgi:ubiquinol-cytochrome c reductase iron-sulfur subunit